MKIAYLIEYFEPFSRGAENNCYYLAKELAKKHDVQVYTSDRKDGKIASSYEVIDNIKVHRFKPFLRFRYYLSITPGLIKILKEDYDIVHVHSFGFIWHDFIVFLLKLRGTKVVNTPHGPFMALPSYNIFQRVFRGIIRFFEFFINKLYDIVIQVNPEQYKWMTKEGVNLEKIKFIPNGISEENFKEIKQNKYKSNKKIISYVGGLQKYKGIEQIIKILPDFKDVKFICVGEGEDRKRLEKIAKDLKVDVVFTGRISDNEKLQVLDASDVFILPSEWEAFGIVILEAMVRGNAIISTKTEGGLFLISKENGFLYDFGNLKQLKEKLEVLLKDKKLLEKIKKNNLKKAKEFLWKDIAKDLEKVYKELR
ncbi:glycosyltransferase family 4 protein [Candidatus Woesearchaeota archaeon]|nr:glycosyltransferase family 4 protein [Candidatus Woesearchaeota archaeon]